MPYQNLKIVPTVVGSINGFEITTEDGTKYTFDVVEVTTDKTAPIGGIFPGHINETHNSTWQLSKIEAPGGDVVTLNYTPYTVTHTMGVYTEKFDNVQTTTFPACVPSQYDQTIQHQITVQRLTSITTAAHTITFVTDPTLRTDALSPTGVAQEPRLDSIRVATPSGTVIRKFKFVHDYSTGRLTLKQLFEQDATTGKLPPYAFTYDAQTLPARTSFSVDHWGFYNGAGNSTNIPADISPAGQAFTGGDKTANPTFARAGILTKITYPTGGSSQFVYEGNTFGAVGGSASAPVVPGPVQTASAGADFSHRTTTQNFTIAGAGLIQLAIINQIITSCVTGVGCPLVQILQGSTVVAGPWTASGTPTVALVAGTYTASATVGIDFSMTALALINVTWRDMTISYVALGGGMRVSEVQTADGMGNTTYTKYNYALQQTPTVVSLVNTIFADGLGRTIQYLANDGANFVVTANQFDGAGRPWRTWKPYNRAAAGYDASFSTNATSFYNTYLGQTLAKPYAETQYTADPLDRVKKVIPEFVGSSSTVFTQYAYGVDAAVKQRYTELTDEVSKKTQSYSNYFGDPVKSILGYSATEQTTTTFTPDIVGERTQATDPRGLNTTFSFDTRGLVTSRTSPDAGTASSKYDKGGNLRFVQDANQAAAGAVYFTSYDFAGRPLTTGQGTATFSTLDPDAAPSTLETTNTNWQVVRAYDAKPSTAAFPWSLFSTQIGAVTLSNVSGRLTAHIAKSNGSWQVNLFSYDTDGRVATRHVYTHANGGTTVLTAVNTTVIYARNLTDALTQRSMTVGANTFFHWFDYDTRGTLWKAYASATGTKPGTPDVTYTYTSAGQVQNRQFSGGPAVPYVYTIRDQLDKLGDPALTTYPFSAKYPYHANGTIAEAEFYNAGSPAAAKRYKYTFAPASYDALNRLKSADFSSWSGSAWTSTLAHDLAGINYDLSGNLTSLQRYRETGTLIDNLTYTNSVTSNRLNSVTDAIAATPETWDAETGSFTYDANGNLKTAPAPYGITAVTYDQQNLPITITANAVTTNYRYDQIGQRITKQVWAGNTEFYLLEGASPLGVFTVNGAGTLTSWYFTVMAGDKVVGRQPNVGSRLSYHPDLLGSTRSVVNGATVTESYDFEPFGLLMPGRSLLGGTKEGFTGKELDSETGLTYFGARYYLTALGRWGAPDAAAGKRCCCRGSGGSEVHCEPCSGQGRGGRDEGSSGGRR